MIASFRPEYLHVLLNPLPVYGLGLSVLGLLLALISRTRAARVTALALVFVCSISAWPVYHYGEAAYDRVKATVDDDGEKWLDEHVRRGERLIWVFYVVAAFSAIAITAEYKSPRWATPLAIAILIAASTGLLVGGYIAYAGGRVRHPEFRSKPPPESQTTINSDVWPYATGTTVAVSISSGDTSALISVVKDLGRKFVMARAPSATREPRVLPRFADSLTKLLCRI